VAGSSWGGWLSTTQLSGTSLDNLLLDVTGAQNAASEVDYACLFVVNNTASGNPMLNPVLWLPSSADVPGGTTVSVALDPTAASVKGATVQQAVKITAQTSAPAGVSGWVSNTGTQPTTPSYTNGLQLGTIPAGSCRAVWVRRTAANTTPVNADGFGLEVDFDTGA